MLTFWKVILVHSILLAELGHANRAASEDSLIVENDHLNFAEPPAPALRANTGWLDEAALDV